MKLIALSCFILVALQGLTQAAHIPEPRGIVEDIETLIKKLIDEVHNDVEQLEQEVDKIIDQIQQSIPGIVEEVKAQLQEALTHIEEIVKEIIQKEQEGIAQVQSCVAEQESNINDLNDKINNDVQQCISSQVGQVEGIVAEIRAAIVAIRQEVADVVKHASECNNPICIISVGTEALNVLKDAKTKAAFVEVEVIALAESIVKDAIPCLNEVAQEVNSLESVIANNIRNCVYQHLHG